MEDLFGAAASLRPDYERLDWRATPLGPVWSWDPALRAAVDLTLNTRFAVTLFWGPQLVLIYNEAYREMIGDKHPAALGAPARDVFPEIWDVIGPMLEQVTSGRGSVGAQNQRLLIERRGFAEETYFTFSYSALRDEHGVIQGAIDIAAETSEQVRSLRRLSTITQLGEQLSRLASAGDLRERALPVLRAAGEDLRAVDIRPASTVPADALPVGDRLPTAPTRPLVGAELLLEDTPHGKVAWLPLDAPTASEGCVLVVLLSPHLRADDDYLGYLRLIGSALTRALERLRMHEVEQAHAELSRSMAETFQRSLLTPPRRPRDHELAVRYRPAVQEAQVGGDWYDAFPLPDGSTTFVVGDVTGHDQDAAAAMAQVRNLLRGVAYTEPQGPAEVLRALDRAMYGLRTRALATAVVGRLDAESPDSTISRVRWSNAGHPAPVLIGADGVARLLDSKPEILLGVQTRAVRTDHEIALEAGATLVLYTDGLIERRGEIIDVSTARLVDALQGSHDRGVEQICDLLLERFSGTADDDIVLLVLRRPRRV